MSILFGVMGWTLARLGSVSFGRAAAWWLLIYVTTLAFSGIPRTISGLAMPILPDRYAIQVFGVITTALVIGSWRRKQGAWGA